MKLDVRFPGEDIWQCITPDLAKKIDVEEREKSQESLRDRLSSNDSMLSSGRNSVSDQRDLRDEAFGGRAGVEGLSRPLGGLQWG